MQSPFAFIRRWSVTLLCWGAMAACAVLIGQRLGPLYAYAAWAGIALLLCAAGAALIRSQPLSTPTLAGRIGYQVVHFGFKASHGKLGIAALMSWGVWCVVGATAVWIVHGWGGGAGGEVMRLAIGVAWAVDALVLCYMWGIVLANRPRADAPEGVRMRVPQSTVKLTMGGAAVLGASGVMWWVMGTPGARLAALIVAAGPLLIVGCMFGGLMLIMMTAGKNARWN